MTRQVNRRKFLQAAGATGVGFWAAGGLTQARAYPGPNERINVAVIGCGGRGGGNIGGVRNENIVCMCDVDQQRARDAFNQFQAARKYTDYRQMLERERNNIDAVVVSTPDHHHALASILAMRMGKHVYCEKPLTHSVWEARQMKEEARRNRVVTQMGNQGTAGGRFRESVEILRGGAIGPIRDVHVWTNRPIWPQGIARPEQAQDIPATMSWDLWLGGAPARPYNSAYAPFNWRGWVDFGTGAIGDMACHTMNLPFMALGLEAPESVSAELAGEFNGETYPVGLTVTYRFPARGEQPPVTLKWYERGRPEAELFQGQQPSGSGALIVGERGTMYMRDDYGNNTILLPQDRFRDYRSPEPSLPRSPGHHEEWLRAIRENRPSGEGAPMSNFIDYAAKLTETALLGNVAIRLGGRQFRWDTENLRSPDVREVAGLLRREYRDGWDI